MTLLLLFGGGGLTWDGSTALVGAAGVGGSFGDVWAGSIAQVGVTAISDLFRANQTWAGSIARIGIKGISVEWTGIGMPFGTTGMMVIGRSRSEIQVTRTRTAMMVGTGRARTGDL